jgi:hypothetical protein
MISASGNEIDWIANPNAFQPPQMAMHASLVAGRVEAGQKRSNDSRIFPPGSTPPATTKTPA